MRMPWLLMALACLACVGCAVAKQMLAAPDDLADYRAFRVAAEEGRRLARADNYLKRHPRGAWAGEVRAVFEAEEGTWFEAAKTSRTLARDYLVDLPHGPHADAARALLAFIKQDDSDIDTLVLLADSRRMAATLDVESVRREQVSDVVLEELSVLLDPTTPGAVIDDPPRALASALPGPPRRTWGTGPSAPPPKPLREDQLSFVVRTPTGPEKRIAQVRLRLNLAGRRVVGGRIEGADLFIRWTEANEVRVLDTANVTDRATAASAVLEILGGALEARFPAARCTARPRQGDILARACDGWRSSARMGARPGDEDVISVQGPAPLQPR
jgi:hypothetical protein